MSTIPSYGKRLVFALLLALPLSVLLAAMVWSGDASDGLSLWERLQAIGMFLSLSGAVIAIAVSATHTWLRRRGYILRWWSGAAIAVGLGCMLGALVGASWSSTATASLGGWGAALGLLYVVAVFLLDRGGAHGGA